MADRGCMFELSLQAGWYWIADGTRRRIPHIWPSFVLDWEWYITRDLVGAEV